MNEEEVSSQVENIINLESSLANLEAAMMEDPQFRQFLTKQKEVQSQIADYWKEVEEQMVSHDIKSIKGTWGSLTIAERLNWSTDETLPAKFYKKVVDSKKISDTFRLEGKAPKGTTPSTTKYLVKRLKSDIVKELLD